MQLQLLPGYNHMTDPEPRLSCQAFPTFLPHQIPQEGFESIKLMTKILSREEFIKLAGPTGMAFWAQERTCLLFFLPRFCAYIIPMIK